MEPMTLGSPVGSPTTQSAASPYLPGFLMGDPLPQPTSPSKTPRQVTFAPNLSTSMHTQTTPLAPGHTSLNDSLSRYHKNQREKSGGPPTVGLFDTLEVSSSVMSSSPPSASFQQPSQLSHSQTHSEVLSPTLNSHHSEDSGERWVTVFGFPPATASSILGQFSQVGHIVEHRFPGQGNWVNICYATKLDARRALSYNGKVLGGHTMVGVVPCREFIYPPTYLRRALFYNENTKSRNFLRAGPRRCVTQPGSVLRDMTNNVLSNTGTPNTPSSPQVSRLSQRRLLTSPSGSPYLTSPRAIRPLGISSPADNEVIGPQNTPTKNTSFVTKAVDFVFGW